MAHFFIDRPVFSWVIAIIIMLAGGLSILTLPVSQYPNIAPPSVTIQASYPGANAKTLEDSVTQIVEQKMTGLDGLLYMDSTSDSFGNASVTLTFDAGTDPDIAQMQVQNKLQLAMPLLPDVVQQQGLQVTKSLSDILMVLAFISTDGSKDNSDLGDFLVTTVRDPLSRVEGVGDVQVFGGQYSMRIWLDPAKLVAYRLMPSDVSAALRTQNVEISAGQLGGTPSVPGQGYTASITAGSRLQTVEQFEHIVLKKQLDGSEVRLKDVARVELGQEIYNFSGRYNGQPAAGLAIKRAVGSNALATAEAVEAAVDKLRPSFPDGVDVMVAFDTTPFVRISIHSVIETLIEAIILVFCVMYLFLQNVRATLIATLVVPVVLLGTFGVMAALGFSINTLTLFGLVLAIGLLVDDAIVVVENVERVMSEEGLSPKEATKKSMSQITGALIGIGLVLSAVFIPMAFFPGSVGVIYRQFSVTIAAAVGLSVLVAIVFTPALCATILKPVEKGHHLGEGGPLGAFFHWFNDWFARLTGSYQGKVEGILRRGLRFMFLYLLLVGALVFSFLRLPSAFLPEEDQGVLFAQIMLPAGATQERTLEVMEKMRKYFEENESDDVASVMAVAGFSFSGSGQNVALAFVRLKDWEERDLVKGSARAIQGRAMMALSQQIKEAQVFAFVPPAIPGLGTSGGFTMVLQDRGELGHDKLLAARNQLLGMAMQDPMLANLRPNGVEDSPQYEISIDRDKAMTLGVNVADINSTLAIALGSQYVNDFIDRGRVKRVVMQGDDFSRMNADDLSRWYVRNSAGEMTPFSAFMTGKWNFAPSQLKRYNGVGAMQLQGEAAPGFSSGQAMDRMEELAAQIPGVGVDWTGLSYEERLSSAMAPALYALSLLVVFLCLAALYESWVVPFAVVMVVPLGVLGAVLAVTVRGLADDIYFQIGLLATIGLSAKNAILIVEFAKEQVDRGVDVMEATLAAVRMRLRPIVMTSLAFTMGVLPLVKASGAGASSQHSIGTGVLGGTIFATLLGIFFIPLFYVLIQRQFRRKEVV